MLYTKEQSTTGIWQSYLNFSKSSLLISVVFLQAIYYNSSYSTSLSTFADCLLMLSILKSVGWNINVLYFSCISLTTGNSQFFFYILSFLFLILKNSVNIFPQSIDWLADCFLHVFYKFITCHMYIFKFFHSLFRLSLHLHERSFLANEFFNFMLSYFTILRIIS